MGRNWEQTTVCSCLFSQSFMFPPNLFILTSSENTVHQAAREKQQVDLLHHFTFCPPLLVSSLAVLPQGDKIPTKIIKENYYVSYSALLETDVCSCLIALLVVLKVLETVYFFFPSSSVNSLLLGHGFCLTFRNNKMYKFTYLCQWVLN